MYGSAMPRGQERTFHCYRGPMRLLGSGRLTGKCSLTRSCANHVLFTSASGPERSPDFAARLTTGIISLRVGLDGSPCTATLSTCFAAFIGEASSLGNPEWKTGQTWPAEQTLTHVEVNPDQSAREQPPSAGAPAEPTTPIIPKVSCQSSRSSKQSASVINPVT